MTVVLSATPAVLKYTAIDDYLRVTGRKSDPHLFRTHSLRRSEATLIYRRTGNLRAMQRRLRQTKIESTVRYLGIEVDDSLAIPEQVYVCGAERTSCGLLFMPALGHKR